VVHRAEMVTEAPASGWASGGGQSLPGYVTLATPSACRWRPSAMPIYCAAINRAGGQRLFQVTRSHKQPRYGHWTC
jgi:hypothetical protein